MKNLIVALFAVVTLTFASCDNAKKPAENTTTTDTNTTQSVESVPVTPNDTTAVMKRDTTKK